MKNTESSLSFSALRRHVYTTCLRIIPFAILVVFFTVCVLSQREKSVTVDEFAHFPAGIFNLTMRDWRMDNESPPLVKCLPGGVTANLTNPIIPRIPPDVLPNAWNYGYRFMYENFPRYIDIITWGRVVIIIVSCIGGWLVYRFGERLFGQWGGIVSLLLYAANPNIIAHAQLVTIDAGASVFFLVSVFLFWKFLGRMNVPSAITAGIGLGVAELSKFTALILIPVMLAIVLITAARQEKHTDDNPEGNCRTFLSSLCLFCLVLAICIVTINTGYLFSGTFFTLDDHIFSSDVMKWLAATPIRHIPVPLPVDYVSGFDIQMAISQGNNPFYMGYLMGEHSMTGWWYYYPVSLFVKNPEVIWGFAALSFWAWFKIVPRLPLRTWLCLWGIPFVFIAYFSIFTNTPIGIRFLLPIFALLFIAFGGIVRFIAMKQLMGKVLLGMMLFVYCLPAFAIFPDYLSYFNSASGGPQNGHRWLIDSNIDWGQDLPALKRYMTDNGVTTIKLGYFGRVDPRIYGIDYTLADRQIGEGLHAISVNFLVGRPYYLLAEGTLRYIDFDYYAAYRSLVPITVLGNTIFIFSGVKNLSRPPEGASESQKGLGKETTLRVSGRKSGMGEAFHLPGTWESGPVEKSLARKSQ